MTGAGHQRGPGHCTLPEVRRSFIHGAGVFSPVNGMELPGPLDLMVSWVSVRDTSKVGSCRLLHHPSVPCSNG